MMGLGVFHIKGRISKFWGPLFPALDLGKIALQE